MEALLHDVCRISIDKTFSEAKTFLILCVQLLNASIICPETSLLLFGKSCPLLIPIFVISVLLYFTFLYEATWIVLRK